MSFPAVFRYAYEHDHTAVRVRLSNIGTGFEVVLHRGSTIDTFEAYGDQPRWLSVNVQSEINVTHEWCQKDHSRLLSQSL